MSTSPSPSRGSFFNPLKTLFHRAKQRAQSLCNKDNSKSLTHQLSSAQRVNARPSSTREDTDYCHPTETQRLNSLITPVEGDGLWKCCNAHEQELIHWSGPHPFKYLKCIHCQHVLCQRCCTTAVLSQITWHGARLVDVPKKSKDEVFFGQICPSCSLTHRARVIRTVADTNAHEVLPMLSFDGTLCTCGRLADSSWVRFKIGPIYEYRRDPHNAFAELNLQRAESSVFMGSANSSAASLLHDVWTPSPVQERGFSTSTSSLSLENEQLEKTKYRPSGLSKGSTKRSEDDDALGDADHANPFDELEITASTNF